jgi:hypothetical protein
MAIPPHHSPCLLLARMVRTLGTIPSRNGGDSMKAKLNPVLRSVEITHQDETQTIYFQDLEEWQSVIFGAQTFDIHFHYEKRSLFTSDEEWGKYIIQCYLVSEKFNTILGNSLLNEIKIEL